MRIEDEMHEPPEASFVDQHPGLQQRSAQDYFLQ